MTITEYVDLVTTTKEDVFCKDELVIEDDFDTNLLLELCSSDLLDDRHRLAWDMIVSAVAEKFKDSEIVDFFQKTFWNFL